MKTVLRLAAELAGRLLIHELQLCYRARTTVDVEDSIVIFFARLRRL